MNTFGIIGFLVGITNISIGLIVYFDNPKKRPNQLWLFFAITVAIWGFGSSIISIIKDPSAALYWWRLIHIGIILIPTSLLLFTYSFLGRKNRLISTVAISCSCLFLIANLTKQFIYSVRIEFNSFYYDSSPTYLYTIFVIFFFITFIYILTLAIRAYFSLSDPIKKRQVLFFIIATTIGSLGGSTSFLPVYNIALYPYLNSCIIFFPFIIGYAILRYRLFDIKVIVTDLLIFSIWLFGIFRLLLTKDTADLFANVLFLIILILLGWLVIKSGGQEVKAHQQLRELDELKTKFVGLATHHIASPLTAIRGYVSLLQEGIYGQKSGPELQTLNDIDRLTSNLTTVIQDFLDVSKIENKETSYNFIDVDMKDIVSNIILRYETLIEKRNIKFKYNFDIQTNYTIKADPDKLFQAISNILDNSMKYTQKGSISLKLLGEKRKIILKIADTGDRILPESSAALINKFSSTGDSREAKIVSNSLGLYVAKQIIEAHSGSFTIKSTPGSLGAEFILCL